MIHSYHIEIGAGEVTFVAVVGLKYHRRAAAVTGERIAHFRHPIIKCGVGGIHNAEGIVAFLHIGIAIGGIEVVDVGVSLVLCSTPPTFRETVLAVHATGACPLYVGIHIPIIHAVGIHVGAAEMPPKRVICELCVVSNHTLDSRFEFFGCLAVDSVIVAHRNVGACR